MKQLFSIFLILIALISCTPSTQIVSSWKDPASSMDIKGVNKILVVALVKNPSVQRSVEDKLVSIMKAKGVPSYNYLTDEMVSENGKLVEKLKSDGFNGVLIMRLMDVEKETSYVPGSTSYPGYYGSYYGYYRHAAPMYNDPGYYKTDKHYNVETTVYTTNPDKLVWTATTKTINPDNFDAGLESIATAVGEKMRKDGFIIDK